MIEYRQANLFECGAEAIVNTVNCVGVMGRGIALQCKRLFPENFREYETACKAKRVLLGKMFITETGREFPRYIINFPTKGHWREKSQIEDVWSGMNDFVSCVLERNIKSVAIPPLGCGNGGLSWGDVRPIIENACASLENVKVIILHPMETSFPLPVTNREKEPLTYGRAALIYLMQRYLDGMLDPFITLLELQKLMYFLQESGDALRLNYKKYLYGPYAENLRHVLNRLEGVYISGYQDGGDSPSKRLTILPGALQEANRVLCGKTDTMERMNRVGQLIDGFELPFGMELLATVHWVAKYENKTELSSVIQGVHDWNERKKRFTEHHITAAYRRLTEYGWL